MSPLRRMLNAYQWKLWRNSVIERLTGPRPCYLDHEVWSLFAGILAIGIPTLAMWRFGL